MKQLPQGIIDAITSSEAVEPMALLAVWATKGPEDRLISPRQLSGVNDVASASDSNMTMVNGSIVLSPGNTVALDTAATAGGIVRNRTWSGTVRDVFAMVWA